VKSTLDYNESTKASFARSAKVNIIIGLKARSNGNVKAVNSEQPFVVEQKWNIQN
jgi:hypothetical protein